MKKIYRCLFVAVLLSVFCSSTFSQSNYITLGNLGTTSFCATGTLSVPFTTNMVAGTIFKVYLSDYNGSFSAKTEIGNGMSSPINVTFPSASPVSNNYKIRIESVSPSVLSPPSSSLREEYYSYISISVKNSLGTEMYGGSICQGSAITENISSNLTEVIYEWKKNGTSQSTNSSYRITQSGTYTASVEKIGCSKTERSLSINFVQTINHSSIRNGEQYQCAGGAVFYYDNYFSDSATYQWKKDGINLVGKVKDTLTVTQTGIYKADVSDKCNVVQSTDYSSGVRASVFFSNIIENTISENSGQKEVSICGSSIYRELSRPNFYPNSLAPYSFQWKKNGVNIANETRDYLSLIRQEGAYSLELKQGSCTVNSNGISIIKKDTIKLKLYVYELSSEKICPGLNTSLQYDYYYGLNYTLYKDGAVRTSGFRTTEAGKYVLTGTTSGCVILPSDTVKVTVGNITKVFIENYRPTVCSGGVGDLGVYQTFSALPNVSYQWLRNNQFYAQTVGGLLPAQPGFYQLRITSGSCVGTSDSTEVKFTNQLEKPTFKGSYPSTIQLCNNSLIKFGTNTGVYNNFTQYDSLFWKRNGVVIVKKDFYPSFTITQSGIYTVIRKQNTCISPESDPIEVKIGEPITANITGSTSIYAGQKADLNLSFTGGNAWAYKTSDVAITQNTILSSTIKSVSPTITTTYTLTSIASNCGLGAASGLAKITVCNVGQSISMQSGDWNASSTWACGQIPTPTLDAIIDQGHTVSLPNGYQGNAKKLELKGGIRQGVGASLRVNN